MNQTTDTQSYTKTSSNSSDISDDSVNAAYNYLNALIMFYHKDVHVGENRNFRKRKTAHPEEWLNFVNVIKLCRKYNFHLKCYITYCYINRLIPHCRGKMLSDVRYLKNPPQIIDYTKNKEKIESNYEIANSIKKTARIIKGLNEQYSLNTKNTLIKIIESGKLSDYISSGVISPFFLSLIPNARVFVHRSLKNNNTDKTVIMDLCERMGILKKKSVTALSMFEPRYLTKTISEICS